MNICEKSSAICTLRRCSVLYESIHVFVSIIGDQKYEYWRGRSRCWTHSREEDACMEVIYEGLAL
jgi:hypothetical protein